MTSSHITLLVQNLSCFHLPAPTPWAASTMHIASQPHCLCSTSIWQDLLQYLGFPGSSDSKIICLQCRGSWFDPWIGNISWSPGEGNSYPLQYSCLEKSMDRPWGSQSRTRLSDFQFALHYLILPRNSQERERTRVQYRGQHQSSCSLSQIRQCLNSRTVL